MEELPPKHSKQNLNILSFFSLGLQLVLSVGILALLGNWLDKKLTFSFPLFLLFGIIVGLTASVLKILAQVNKKKY